MKFSDVASYFDDLSFKDAYSGVHSFYGQMDVYTDSQREGVTSVRRIMSVTPGTTVPSRGVAKAGSDYWLMSGNPSHDYFQGDTIRSKYILHRADGLASIKTISQELSNSSGVSAYGAAVWLKGVKEVDESSYVDNEFTMYFSPTEALASKTLVSLLGRWYVIRYTYRTATGFTASVADQLDAPNFETVSYAKRAYNPVTDAHTSTSVNVKVLRLRWQSKFEYLSQASTKYQEGDDVVMVLAADITTPTTGDRITLSDGVRTVEGIQADGNLWHLHVRRA